MARTAKAKVIIEAEDRASGEVRKAQGAFSRFGGFLKSPAFLGSIVAVTATIGKAAAAVRDWVRASAEQEDAVARLRGALAPLGASTERVTQALAAQASQIQANSRFGDEAIIAAQALLANFTREEEQIKALTQVTVDFSQALGVDLNSAANLIGKTLGSSTNALARYGVEVEGAAGSSDRLQSIVENSAALFGGQAKAAVDSYAGAVQQLKNTQGDLGEVLGDTITQAEGMTEAIQEQEKAYQALIQVVKESDNGIGSLAVGWEKLKAAGLGTLAVLGQQANFLLDFVRNGDAASDTMARLAKEQEGANEKLDRFAVLAQRAAEAEKRLTGETASFAEAINKLGVELETDLRAEMEANNALLLEADRLYREGGISARDYEAAVDAVAKKNAELRAEQERVNVETRETATATSDAALNTDTYAESLSRARTQLQNARGGFASMRSEMARTSEQARITAADFDQIAQAAGRAAAVAASVNGGGGRLVLGGTRILLPGGGSRLTTAPGGSRIGQLGGNGGLFPGLSGTSGTFTTITNRT